MSARVGLAAVLVVVAAAGAAAEPRLPAAAPPPRTHVVAKGDTLGGIASRYGVTVHALVAANRLASEHAKLRVGQRLAIPTAVAVGPSTGPRRPPRVVNPPRAGAVVPVRATVPPPTRGPRGLELAVPDFLDIAPLFAWPIEGPVTSTFGRRRSGWHRGIDIKANQGAVIFAAASGTVAVSDVEPRYGRVVKIEHDDGYVTVYAHNEENLVQPGMRVAAGDPIATIGRSGRATAYHVHFEIRHNGSVYNPLYLLPLPPRVGQVEESDEPEEEHD